MPKIIAMLLAAMLCAVPALCEAGAAPPAAIEPEKIPAFSGAPGPGEVTGEPDSPALKDPGARYEYYTEETDGSEYMMFAMLDAVNDEAADITEYGALFITENQLLNDEGVPAVKIGMTLQDSPYGTVLISNMRFLWIDESTYSIGTHTWTYDGSRAEEAEGFEQELFDYYTESYHFPYGSLEAMNGVRQDENGYTYYLIRSSEEMSFEFVVGEGMRIVQLRVYTRNEDGELALTSYADYATGPAVEIPQPVLDAMGEVLTPVAEAEAAPEDGDPSMNEESRKAISDNLMEEEPEA